MRISGVKMAAGVGGAVELLSKAVVVNAAAGKHSATLLFLHGLGDTGHGWAEQLAHIRHPSLKIVCPNAPVAPVTLNGGFRMPSWFDIYSLDKTSKQDEEGLQKAAKEIHEILDAECSEPGMSPDRIILGNEIS
ncbi:Acyl-protein thioesterase 1, partial [Geodia barretti]